MKMAAGSCTMQMPDIMKEMDKFDLDSIDNMDFTTEIKYPSIFQTVSQTPQDHSSSPDSPQDSKLPPIENNSEEDNRKKSNASENQDQRSKRRTSISLHPNLLEKSLLGRITKSSQSTKASQEANPVISRQGINLLASSCVSNRDQVHSSAEEQPGCFLPYIMNDQGILDLFDNKSRKSQDELSSVDKEPKTRVEAALDAVVRLRAMRREDRINGVPTNFNFTSPSERSIILEEETGSKSTKANSITRQRSKDSSVESTEGKICKKKPNRNPSKSPIRTRNKVIFPKDKDFIPLQSSVSSDNPGCEWKIPGVSSQQRIQTSPRKVSNQGQFIHNLSPAVTRSSTIPGKLCSSKYPLAEALRKEGTSVEKLRGRVLDDGDWNVVKVWPRMMSDIRLNTLPVQMANKDVPLFEKMKKRTMRTPLTTAGSMLQSSRFSLDDDL